MRLLPEFGVLGSDPLFDMSYPKSGAELTETIYVLMYDMKWYVNIVCSCFLICYSHGVGSALYIFPTIL